MTSTQTVSVLSTRIEFLEAEREILLDDLARSKMPLRQTLVIGKLAAVEAELEYLIGEKEEYE